MNEAGTLQQYCASKSMWEEEERSRVGWTLVGINTHYRQQLNSRSEYYFLK